MIVELDNLHSYCQTFSAWLASGYQDESCLLRGQALQEVLDWLQGKSLSNLDYQFLVASQELERRQLQQKLEGANEELQRLSTLATIDCLTQVANRRRFEEYLDIEWRRMTRSQQPLSLILVDVDFFKSYNDTYGHPMGDRCLSKIAKVIKDVVQRPTDLVARYGGEEFAVILSNTDILGAAHIAEKICFAVRKLAIPHENSQLSSYVTLSAGLATVIPISNSNSQKIIVAADKALYQAKAAGRDRVCSQEQTENLEAKLFLSEKLFIREELWLSIHKSQQIKEKNQQLRKQVQEAMEKNQQIMQKNSEIMYKMR
ncbi:diguanylate cyclase [Nostoc sp. NMS8]|uniref:diguanylate cyclase n=1 Tax=Nostoc sp. NMS8 TaxID=2815392 RepID=UPI0025D854AC|nr:diguanylate cyclase [Nostoc sp. NMS8]MBN3961032.1 diguanylate cyclase [Nostoc sp. NMS8]